MTTSKNPIVRTWCATVVHRSVLVDARGSR